VRAEIARVCGRVLHRALTRTAQEGLDPVEIEKVLKSFDVDGDGVIQWVSARARLSRVRLVCKGVRRASVE
jgi:hypothetical protein